jgi:LPS-assembly protein
VTLDLDHYMRNSVTPVSPLGQRDPTISAFAIGAGYRDECTTLEVTYSSTPRQYSGAKDNVQTVLLRLELRTLGQASVTQNLSGASSADGVAP